MPISIRLSEEENKLIRKVAQIKHKTVSEFIRETLIETIELEFDMQLLQEALSEYSIDSNTITHAEVKKKLGL